MCLNSTFFSFFLCLASLLACFTSCFLSFFSSAVSPFFRTRASASTTNPPSSSSSSSSSSSPSGIALGRLSLFRFDALVSSAG